jgi:hypothetical protein
MAWRTLSESDKRWILRQQQYRCKCGEELDMRNAFFESMLPYDHSHSADIQDLHAICLSCNRHPNREQEMIRQLKEYIEKT